MEYFATIGGKWKASSKEANREADVALFDKKLTLYAKWSDALDRLSAASVDAIADDEVLCEWTNWFRFGYCMLPEDIKKRVDAILPKLDDAKKIVRVKRDGHRYLKHRTKILAYQKRYNEEHKAEIMARRTHYYREHKSKIMARNMQYNEEHKSHILAYRKHYYREHKAKIQAYHKHYNEMHKAEITARHRRYYKTHRTEILAKLHGGAPRTD
jgi:hypothetical protein